MYGSHLVLIQRGEYKVTFTAFATMFANLHHNQFYHDYVFDTKLRRLDPLKSEYLDF